VTALITNSEISRRLMAGTPVSAAIYLEKGGNSVSFAAALYRLGKLNFG
jgi:hypothetical protein